MKKMIMIGLGTIQFFSTSVWASAPKKLEIENALRLPLQSRLTTIERQGLSGLHELRKMAFEKNESLETRWRAVTAIGRIYPQEGRKTLDLAMQSSEWFMRNAALVVAPYGDRQWAVKWARVLMHDPALVVRTAAVQALQRLNAYESQDLLWEKLYSSENYRAGQSLWIRKYILETLAQFARPGQEKPFIRVLADQDQSLHPIAIRTLQKITKQNFSSADQWQAWQAGREKKSI